MKISTRYPHQKNIPLWMVKDLNRPGVSRSNGSHLSALHKRVYWEDVAAYPEVMGGPSDGDTSGYGVKYVKQGRWQGCLRVLPFGNTRKYAPCRFPIYEDNFCYHHIPKARLDGKAPSVSPLSTLERLRLGDISVDAMEYLDNRLDIIEKKIDALKEIERK